MAVAECPYITMKTKSRTSPLTRKTRIRQRILKKRSSPLPLQLKRKPNSSFEVQKHARSNQTSPSMLSHLHDLSEGADPDAEHMLEQFKVHVFNDDGGSSSKHGNHNELTNLNAWFSTEGMETMSAGLGVALEPFTAAMLSGAVPGATELLMEWLMNPLSWEQFEADFLERKPFLVRRGSKGDHYKGWFSSTAMRTIMERHPLVYGKDLDVTLYENGARRTLNGEGRIDPSTVWSSYSQSRCSLRMLHPERFCDPLWLLMSAMEQHFQSIVGCNVYLTPQGSAQGFAPHWDDIDAWVLQLEGEKRWRVYAPREASALLPRLSSRDFEQDEVGTPILDTVLRQGDLLYLPRGTVHQANTLEDTHSLHITLSTGQRSTFADLLEMALPRALELAAEESLCLRRSVPLPALVSELGVSNIPSEGPNGGHPLVHVSDRRQGQTHDGETRAGLISGLERMARKVLGSVPWDAAVDQIAVDFTKRRLPLYGARQWQLKKGFKKCSLKPKFTARSRVKAELQGVARIVPEDDDEVVVYHCLDNDRRLHNVATDTTSSRPNGGCTDGDVDGLPWRTPLFRGLGSGSHPHSAGKLVFDAEHGELLEVLLLGAFERSVGVKQLCQGGADKSLVSSLVLGLYNVGLIGFSNT